MRYSNVRRIVIAVGIIASTSAVLVSAGPFINIQKTREPDDIRSLAGLEKVSIGLVKLPFQLVEAGVRSAQIMGEIRSTMERDAGLSIVDEDAEAHVVFKVKSASHGGPRGVVGFVIFVSVRQDVIIDRLEGEPLRLPTMLHTKLAIVPERSLASRFTTEARLAMEELAGLIVRAKQQRVSPIGN